jgi:hypothetical protein
MNAIEQHYIKEHAVLLQQYLDNPNQDPVILAKLIERIVRRLVRLNWLEPVMKILNVTDAHDFEYLLADRIGVELASDIMESAAVAKLAKKLKKK